MPLLPKPSECVGCDLYGSGLGFSRPEGTGALGVMAMAEALGEEEEKDGLPLRPFAQSGSMFERLLRMCRLSRAQLAIANTIQCRPPRNFLEKAPWEFSAISHCQVHRQRVIDQFKPRVILALGNVATRTLTGMAGDKQGVMYLRGYVLPALQGSKTTQKPCPDCLGQLNKGCFLCDGTGFIDEQSPVYSQIYVVPTVHPSFIQRGKRNFIPVATYDIQLAIRTSEMILRGNKPTRKPVKYITRATLDEARSFLFRAKENLGAPMAYDIETPNSASEDEDKRGSFMEEEDEDSPTKKYPEDYSVSAEEYAITQIQFSMEPYTGIVFPWEGEFIQISRELLALEHTKLSWNGWIFDQPRVESNGCAVNGRNVDLMWQFHHLQPDLPAGLQFACSFLGMDYPWKHLATMGDMGEYGCADVDSLQRAWPILQKALPAKGIERGFERHIMRLKPILWSAAERGMPVNGEKLKAFETKITLAQAELADQKIKPKVQGMDLGNVEPKGGFKPTNTGKVRSEELMALINSGKTLDEIAGIVHRNKDGDTYRYVQKEFVEPQKVDLLDGNLVSGPAIQPQLRWCRMFDFNPGSAKQIMSYMTAKKHPIPTAWKTDKPTTAKEELERLAKKVKDPFYTDILEYRKFDKMISTYCVGWRPKEDGCVHTTWTFRPAIGQLSCCAHWTPVRTYRGVIPIDEVEVGDMVWTHQRRWRPVLATWKHPDEFMVEVHFSTGQVLTCTTSHKLLVLDHVDKQELDDNGERGESSEPVSWQGSPYRYLHLSEVAHIDPHDYVDTNPSNVFSGIYSVKKAPILSVEDGNEESHARENWRTSSQLDWRSGRWVRVSDLFGGWCESIRASSGNGEGSRYQGQGTSREHDSSSHRRRSKEQPSRQFSSRDQGWPCHHTYLAACRLKGVAIEKVVAVGCLPVHDITVEEDESYESCGIFSHNSTGPNIQNSPAHVALAGEFRDCIEAPPGHKIVEFDYKSFFVITMGFEAKDEQWIRMGRMDIHSYLGAYAMHLPERDRLISMPDDELRDRLAWIKKNYRHERDYKWKRAVLGYNNGLGYRKLYYQHREYFSGENEAKQLLQTLDAQFPKACRWREEIRHQAQRDYRLVSRHGYHRLFHDVLVYWGQGKIEDAVRRGRKVPPICPVCKQRHEHGEEAEQATAFLAANDAFGHIKDSVVRLSGNNEGPWNREAYQESWLGRAGFCNTVHDSLVFIMPDRLIDEAVPAIYAEMTRPSEVLIDPIVAPDGLICDVEASIGQTWHKENMETISIQTGMSIAGG